ncbi:serine protease Do [Paenibacillus algorifonticola]|uniref:Serine protease Do n=1 Tax=Paenibacillus algorifonticola TaxID=684063 RepID=A0A1I2DPN9_9BACL|nr:trypsin-like peptidase domain-containing protein [Paenibacillus algorifonticola]SFE82399.1 serine protease Do [Paenibacillus algorifonticola]
MGLFDDDFYSTKVSRRTRAFSKERRILSSKQTRRNWSSVRIAFISSSTSAIAAVLLFGLFFNGGVGGSAKVQAVSTAKMSDDSESLEMKTIQASAKVRPAVVSVINEQQQVFSMGVPNEEGEGSESKESTEKNSLQQAGVGSGFIFKKENGKAYIMTNYHVTVDADALKVTLISGEERAAKIIGEDQISDLAVLEIDDKGIDTIAEIGDSSALQPAEFVIAIGNPLGLGDSLSMGIVSKTRQIVPVSLNQDGNYDWEQEVIQVDASINQGNSGGPLINLDGQVVGINSMKIADIGVEGLGFAIPTNNAMPIVSDLLANGYVPRPYLGVYTMDLAQYFAQQGGSAGGESDSSKDGSDDEAEGAAQLILPEDVRAGVIVLEAVGPAKEAGLVFNDVIVRLDKQAVGSTMELRKYLYSKKHIGDKVEVTFYRDGKLTTAQLSLTDKVEE